MDSNIAHPFEKKVLEARETERMRSMAGYRNRTVHFYHEMTPVD